jgi:hypothetical protein
MLAARELISESIRPSTRERYKHGYARWEQFCAVADVPTFPADSEHVAACLAIVASESQSVSAVESVYAAVSHRHKLEGVPPPTSNPTICLLMRAIRRKFGRPRRQVKPLNDEVLRRMIDYLNEAEHSLPAG